MAYNAPAAAPVITTVGGRRFYHYSISETGAGTASEFTLTGAPRAGRIVLYKSKLTAGTGATIQPKFGRATNPTSGTVDYVGGQAAAAASFSDASALAFDGLTAGVVYVRSGVNAGSDNAISTEITIAEGAA